MFVGGGQRIQERAWVYDPTSDYQTGEVRASASEQQSNEEKRELPAAVDSSDAKALVQRMLAIAWSKRDKLTLRLPPRYLSLAPGDRLALDLSPAIWSVEKCMVEGFVAVVELRPAFDPASSLGSVPADSGRIVPNRDVETSPLRLVLLDTGNVLQQPLSEPSLILAASTASPGWKRRPVQMTVGGRTISAQTAARKSLLGRALTILPPGEPFLIDMTNTVDVELIDSGQWLLSCDDDALGAGMNLAVIGTELLQFADVTSLGQGQFRLRKLLRGRGGTEWANAGHAVDDVFCVIEPGAVRPVTFQPAPLGAVISAASQYGPGASTTMSAESVRPLAPVNLTAEIQPTGDLALSWTRRTRNAGTWLDEVDVPLAESVERYRVTLTGSVGTVELLVGEPSLSVAASQLADLGAGPAVIEVRQVGDLAASRPAQAAITLP